MREQRTTYLLLTPALAIFGILFVVPVLFFFVISFWQMLLFSMKPGFTLVNYDEGGSCRAALGGFSYTPFIGYQTIALASALGNPPPSFARENAVKVARSYTGDLSTFETVTDLGTALLNAPHRYRIDWQASRVVY